jgi:2-methylcitrate dehydratase PrpD
VQALMQRVDVTLDAQCAADFPGRRSARVAITLKDGRVLRHYQATRKGDPDAPLSDAELTAKYFELTTPAIGHEAAAGLLARLWALEGQRDVRFAAEAEMRAAE